MKIQKKVMKAMAVFVAAAMLAGCGGGGGKGDADSGSGSGDAGLLNVESLENPNVALDLYWDANEFEQAAIDKFEQKYGGKVTVTVIGWNGGIEQVQKNMAAGTPSDLMFIEGNQCFPKYAIKDYLQPVTEYVQDDLGGLLSESAMNCFRYKDDYWTFTTKEKASPYIMAFYQPLFEDNGLETPLEAYENGEWTWDKLLEYMEELTVDTDGDGKIDQWGLGPRYLYQNFASESGIEGVIQNEDGTLTANWGDKNMLKYFQFIKDAEEIQARAEGNDGWLGEKGAIYTEIMDQGMVGLADADGNIEGNDPDKDFVPLPTLDGKPGTTPVWDNGYAIPNGAGNPKGGAVLAAMILDEYRTNYTNRLYEVMRPEQIERYEGMLETVTYKRKENNVYEGVTMNYGEAEAREGKPAATIVDTYKDVVENEVKEYNKTLK